MSIVTVVAVLEPEVNEDGRRRRAERNRTAVVDALLSLYDEGNPRPGVADIAARAGVSPRSVFRHFDDLEALAATAIERQWTRVHELFEPPSPGGHAASRVTALVAQRVRLHDTIIGVARAAALIALSSPTVSTALHDRRQLLADQVTSLFAAELESREAPARHDLAAALQAAASLEHVDYLRTQTGLDAIRTAAVLERTLLALLNDPTDGPPDQV
jgi:TetR/AcrR family transcriptional regulator of autoinduction and epiphytic fitness